MQSPLLNFASFPILPLKALYRTQGLRAVCLLIELHVNPAATETEIDKWTLQTFSLGVRQRLHCKISEAHPV